MPVEFHVSLPNETGLSSAAEDELKKCVTRYTERVITEAKRLEAGEGSDGDPQEVERGMIKQADRDLLRFYHRPKPRRMLAIQLASYVATLLVPITAGYLNQSWGPATFIVVLGIAVTLTAITIFRDQQN